MAYSGKHTWVTGETITAVNLNNLEEGVVENKTAITNVTQDVTALETSLGQMITDDGTGITIKIGDGAS